MQKSIKSAEKNIVAVQAWGLKDLRQERSPVTWMIENLHQQRNTTLKLSNKNNVISYFFSTIYLSCNNE